MRSYIYTIAVGVLVLTTGVALWGTLASVGSRTALAANCKEARVDVWVLAASGDEKRLKEEGPIKDVAVSAASTKDMKGCGGSVGVNSALSTDKNGHVRLSPVNPELSPFSLTLSGLPSGAVFEGYIESDTVNPKRDALKGAPLTVSVKTGSKNVVKVYYSNSSPSPTPESSVSDSPFERAIVGIAERIRPASTKISPTPSPTPQPAQPSPTPSSLQGQDLRGTPQTGPNYWIPILGLWGIVVGRFLARIRLS